MSEEIRKLIIIGSGPAGFTSALYSARANLSPLVFAGIKWGGQLMLTTEVENYPGFVEGILGPQLMENFRHQAERFGAQILTNEVTAVDFTRLASTSERESRPFKVFAGGKEYQSQSVIVATGAEAIWLGLPNEQRLIGKGVSSCAPCDAFFFKDKKVVVVGGGDSAMEEALTLTKFASEVTIIHRRDEFRASKIMLDRAKKNPKISFLVNTVVVDVLGKDKVEGVKLQNTKDGAAKELTVDGMFMAIGHKPITDILIGQLELDRKGYIVKKPLLGEGDARYNMMTSVEGVFVAGDVHDHVYRQAVTAAAFGCMAALEAEKWLEAKND